MKIEEILVGDWIDMNGPTQVADYMFSKEWRMLINESKPLLMSSTWAKTLLHLEVKAGLDACYTPIVPYLDLVYESLEFPNNTLVVTVGDNYAPIGRIRYVHEFQHFIKSISLDNGEGKSIFDYESKND
jgi:hypothetical protein